MDCARFAVIASLLLAFLGPVPACAGPRTVGPAARLSAAMGGILDDDLGEAGSLAHPIDYPSIRLIPGRSADYRRRVALEKIAAARMTVTPR
jgi:hypothetical protein